MNLDLMIRRGCARAKEGPDTYVLIHTYMYREMHRRCTGDALSRARMSISSVMHKCMHDLYPARSAFQLHRSRPPTH